MASCIDCNSSFNLFNRKKQCCECESYFCMNCIVKDSASRRRCKDCHYLVIGKDLVRPKLMQLRLRSLKQFLINRRVATTNCKEKYDLIELILRKFGGIPHESHERERQLHTEYLLARQRIERVPEVQSEPVIHGSQSAREPMMVDPPDADFVVVEEEDINDDSRPSENLQFHLHTQDSDQATTLPSYEEATSNRGPPTTETGNVTHFGATVPTTTGQTDPDATSTAPVAPETSMPNQNVPSEDRSQEPKEQPSPPPPATPGRLTISDIQTEEQIEHLSVRQLRELLQQKCVQYGDCKEKRELVEKVIACWKEEKSFQEIDDSTSDDNLCKICLDAYMDCVLLNCGHMLCCTTCGRKLAECPVCRQLVSKVVHVFKA